MNDTPAPASPAILARRLVRSSDRATLATTRRPGDAQGGSPYAALVLIAVDHDASPILLISGLAEHTKDLALDDRAALLVDGTAGLDEPLTGPRATLVGRVRRTDEPRHRTRFLARHPGAAMYADFKDFGFYRMAVERAHLVGGFGRIHWIDGAAFLDPPADAQALVEREADIVGHMNEDHADAVGLYATKLLGQPAAPQGCQWRMTGIDPEGCDLKLVGEGSQGWVARLEFGARIADAERARAELVRLVKHARSLA
ncbi:MAG: HugZ family protein [Rhodospirillales bacterium]|nr:HugZ family protein [Rhodospirillales bacterium]